MAKNDITIFDDGIAIPGSKRHAVHAGRDTAIIVGELVFKDLGSRYVTAWTPGGAASAVKPQFGTDYLVGLAVSTSTETTTADGVVDVMPISPGITFLVDVGTAATWDTQAEYNALVGDRIKLNYAATTGKITALSTDYIYNGAVVEPLDIAVHPGKVRFSLTQRLMYTN